ncbi:unnamed protein product [Mytilus edulis]|uniref:DZIP3-like HEPN domain-containing protein n=1 Tax=Mytilus edulis TaxID=6550 RepID=A0A8S3SYH8_MYTED|nr:unnamed protein product [Mytilus edulis]
MSFRLSQEEENYVRMSLLMTGISPRAARALFDREFAPACLDSSLKREYNKLRDLQKRRIINQQQWNLLFPRFPDVVDSKTFDVTLMITLLRNLTDLTPCNGDYDMLPSPNESTPTSDLARIKCYRNMLAHLDEGKLDNSKFIKAWNDITGAVGRLGGQSMKQECDNLKTKILDQTNQEIMLDIKRSNDEIRELKQSVDSLKIANADLTEEVEKLKDTVPWNIRAQIGEDLVEWKENDKIGYSDIVHAIHGHSRKEKARKKRGNLKGKYSRKRRLDSSESDEDVPLARLKEKIKNNTLMRKRKKDAEGCPSYSLFRPLHSSLTSAMIRSSSSSPSEMRYCINRSIPAQSPGHQLYLNHHCQQ